MKRSRYSDEKIACSPRQAESGMPVADFSRQTGDRLGRIELRGDGRPYGEAIALVHGRRKLG